MRKKIMIIDDDESTVEYLSVLLDDNGYDTLSAYNGKDGFEKLLKNKVDLIVLDVMMPKKTGFVLFNQLKREKKLREIPVVMLTGVQASLDELDAESDDADIRQFDSLRSKVGKQVRNMREEGAVRPEIFMDKPINPKGFIEKIKSLIDA